MNRDIPKRYQKMYEKAKKSRSRKVKIRFHCLECVGFEFEEVGKCTDKECVFYEDRLTG